MPGSEGSSLTSTIFHVIRPRGPASCAIGKEKVGTFHDHSELWPQLVTKHPVAGENNSEAIETSSVKSGTIMPVTFEI